MKLVYPIKETYVSDWTAENALRELVANGIDAETAHGATFSFSYNPARQKLILRNTNIKVPLDALYFGDSNKAGDANLIGKYGEGLKLAMLVLCRDPAYSVKIVNADKLWIPSMAVGRAVDIKTLVVTEKKNPTVENDFYVVVTGVTQDLWNSVQTLFLKLRPVDYVWRGENGDVLGPGEAGNIYVQGVRCTQLPGYKYGYNIRKDVDIGRDRRVPNRHELDEAISEILATRCDTAEDDQEGLRNELYDMLANGKGEASTLSNSGNLYDLRGYFKAKFLATHGQDAVPICNSSESADWQFVGKKPVVVPYALYQSFGYTFDTLETVKRQFARQVTATYSEGQLYPEERQVYAKATRLVRAANNDKLMPVNVVDFKDRNLLGLYTEDTLFLAKHVLKNLGAAVVVLIHEQAHDVGGDGSPAHVRKVELLTAKVINALAEGIQTPETGGGSSDGLSDSGAAG